MQPASRFMRRFWWSCLIMLGLVSVAAGGSFLADAWLPDEAMYWRTLAGGWGLLPPLLLVLLVGILVFWRGRRLLAGTLLSCLLLVLVAAAWAGTYRHLTDAALSLKRESATSASMIRCSLASGAGGVAAELWCGDLQPGYYRSGVPVDKPGLKVGGDRRRYVWYPEPPPGSAILPDSWARRSGFQVMGSRPTSPGVLSSWLCGVIVPYWFVVPWLLIYPALYGRVCWKRAHAPIPGHCAKCGYDLQGHIAADGRTAAGSKCPECGTEIPALPATTEARPAHQG